MTDAEEIADLLAELRGGSTYTFTYYGERGPIVLTNVLKGTKKWRYEDDQMLSQHVETKDLVFDAAQFIGFQKDIYEPTAGVQISQTVSGGVDWYEVVSVNKERVWEFSDNDQTTMRVHTLWRRRDVV